MTACVYYHHPENSQYSLAYVTQDRDEITTSGQDAIIEQYDPDEEFFVLYTNRGASGTVEDLDDEFEDVLDEMSPQNRTITVRLLQIFEEIIEEKELEEQEKLEIYKQIELERIPDALARVDWTGTAIDVAGQLMSTLILKHALPNANHRTSISMAQWYLESIETGFSFPDFATEEYDWKTWVNEYITESKRLLTVRRNTTAFSLLSEWGVTPLCGRMASRSFLQSMTSISLVQRPTRTMVTCIQSSVRTSLLNLLPVLDTTSSSRPGVLAKQNSSRSSMSQNNRVSPEGPRQYVRAPGRVRSGLRRTALLLSGVVLGTSLLGLQLRPL